MFIFQKKNKKNTQKYIEYESNKAGVYTGNRQFITDKIVNNSSFVNKHYLMVFWDKNININKKYKGARQDLLHILQIYCLLKVNNMMTNIVLVVWKDGAAFSSLS